jgi:hypothetical protein
MAQRRTEGHRVARVQPPDGWGKVERDATDD